MYYLVYAPHRAGGLSISSVDVIVYSCGRVFPEPLFGGVNNVRAFVLYIGNKPQY